MKEINYLSVTEIEGCDGDVYIHSILNYIKIIKLFITFQDGSGCRYATKKEISELVTKDNKEHLIRGFLTERYFNSRKRKK